VLTFTCFERTRDVLVELPQHDHERYSHSHTRSAAHHCLTVPHNPPHVVPPNLRHTSQVTSLINCSYCTLFRNLQTAVAARLRRPSRVLLAALAVHPRLRLDRPLAVCHGALVCHRPASGNMASDGWASLLAGAASDAATAAVVAHASSTCELERVGEHQTAGDETHAVLNDALTALEAAGVNALSELKRKATEALPPARHIETSATDVAALLHAWARREEVSSGGGDGGGGAIDRIPTAVVPTLRLLRNCCARGEAWQRCVVPMIPSLLATLERIARDTTASVGAELRGAADGGGGGAAAAAADVPHASAAVPADKQHLLLKPCAQLLGNAVRTPATFFLILCIDDFVTLSAFGHCQLQPFTIRAL
jgi:hypothetical protein